MSSTKVVMNTVLVLTIVAVGSATQGPPMPRPGPEHEAMGVFTGKWNFEGEAKEGPMGAAGKVTFTELCEWFEGGFAIVCRSEGENPAGPTKTISIMSYDTEKKAYTYYAVESGMPAFMVMGKREGKSWLWDAESNMGGHTMKMRITVTETSPTSYTFDMKSSMDGGNTWAPVMEGKSTKS